MSPIDLYIRRATLGLPRRARLDTAAELRVHLNERATALASQGLGQSEAEHLAVEYMGPIEPVNRKFLGHVLTPRLGWIVAGLLLVGLGAWAAANYLFAPAEIAAPRDVVPNDLLPLLGDFTSLEVTMPREARTLSFAVAQGTGELFSMASSMVEDSSGLRPNQRNKEALLIGFPVTALAHADCDAGSRAIFVGNAVGHLTGCVVLPTNTGSWFHATQNNLEVEFDAWQPLLVFQPVSNPEPQVVEGEFDPENLDWQQVTFDPSTWLVLSSYTSRAPLIDIVPLPSPPTGDDVLAKFPWLARGRAN